MHQSFSESTVEHYYRKHGGFSQVLCRGLSAGLHCFLTPLRRSIFIPRIVATFVAVDERKQLSQSYRLSEGIWGVVNGFYHLHNNAGIAMERPQVKFRGIMRRVWKAYDALHRWDDDEDAICEYSSNTISDWLEICYCCRVNCQSQSPTCDPKIAPCLHSGRHRKNTSDAAQPNGLTWRTGACDLISALFQSLYVFSGAKPVHWCASYKINFNRLTLMGPGPPFMVRLAVMTAHGHSGHFQAISH